MLTTYFSDPRTVQRFQTTPAGPHLDDFATALMTIGYRPITIQTHLRAAAHLSAWLKAQGSELTELDESLIVGFKQHLGCCQCDGFSPAYRCHTAGAQRFLQYLRERAVVTAPAPGVSKVPPLLVGFCTWMRQHRGVTQATLDSYGRIITEALETLGDEPQHYEVAGLRAYILDRANHHGRSKAKLMVTALRAFVRYLIAQGQCDRDLDQAIPTLAGWRLATLPPYLPPAQVEQLIGSCDPTTVAGARDRAILLLLARLGLRAGEVAALRLDDIDWHQATLQVSGKSRRRAQLPLPQEVGDAILHYLQYARPDIKAEQVFLRVEIPIGPFARASAVSDIVKRAIARAGISAPVQGAHLLRHSAATAWLGEGVPLESIGVLLRHRSLETTTIYAKVDLQRLHQLAMPWPEITPC